MLHRETQLSRARTGSFDLLVIGGGITGAGVARDAARRGLRVVLVEQADLAQGTSSRSSKLVHGGLRYLEQGELGLVFESVSERRVLMDIAPHLVRPLPFLFPVFKKSHQSAIILDMGMWLYDGLSLFRSPRRHRRLSPDDVAVEEPALEQDGLKSAELYYDCATDDARLTLETALDAVEAGAVVLSRCRVEGFVRGSGQWVRGALLRDLVGKTSFELAAAVVVNATGPWADRTRSLAGRESTLLRPTKGVHIVVDRAKLPINFANVILHPTDSRIMFAIPWGDRSYIGTTDTDWSGDPDDVAATASDVRYCLAAAGSYFPGHPLLPSDVIATWAGLRPLIGQEGVTESKVSREHHVVTDPDGLVTVAGGKLTTYRRMAAEAVDRALDVMRLSGHPLDHLEHAKTDREALPGAVGWPEGDPEEEVAASIREVSGNRLSRETARLFAETYGMRGIDLALLVAARPELGETLVDGRPEVAAQVEWAVTRELATTLADVLVRRTTIHLKDFDQGLGCMRRVAAQMRIMLGWDEARSEQEVADYEAEVAKSRAWRA
jgi:glycerol-3-phosphate dehydrogenase